MDTVKLLNIKNVLARVLKYLVEGMAVALAAYYLPKKKMHIQEVITIAISAAAVFAILDMLAPKIAEATRTGMGIGIGMVTLI